MVNKKKVRFFEGFEFDTLAQAIGNAVLLVVVVGAVAFGTIWLMIHGRDSFYEYEDTVTYYVEQGDTLWVIASRYSDNGKHDVRRVIDLIEEINDCNANIYPGDALEIPVFSCLGG